MSLTFGQARQLLAQYAGRAGLCPDDKDVELFVKEVLQYLLFKGPIGALRTYCFQAREGCITLPFELETPVKVKIDNEVGQVWNSWFKYYDTGFADKHFVPAANALLEEPNYFPTVYDLPRNGSRVGVVGMCEEAEDAHVIVKGFDPTGREIFTVHKGEQISGEYLSIRKGEIRASSVVFGRITNVVKTKTNGYVQLLGVSVPDNGTRCFLSDYSPLEEIPSYRRFRLTTRCRENATVTVIGRVRLKENYADSDVLPVENIHILKTAAQGIQLEGNNDFQAAQAKDVKVGKLLTEENQYKKPNAGQPMDIYHHTSPGTIQNIISSAIPGGGLIRRWWK